jgi:hypothetical protein
VVVGLRVRVVDRRVVDFLVAAVRRPPVLLAGRRPPVLLVLVAMIRVSPGLKNLFSLSRE